MSIGHFATYCADSTCRDHIQLRADNTENEHFASDFCDVGHEFQLDFHGLNEQQFRDAYRQANLHGDHVKCLMETGECMFETVILEAAKPPLFEQEDAETILDEAKRLVSGDRMRDYAPPAVNFDRIARLWSVILQRDVTIAEVALCMVALKLARQIATPKRDNIVDAAGYLYALELADPEAFSK